MHDKNLKIEKKELFAVSSKSNYAIAVESKGRRGTAHKRNRDLQGKMLIIPYGTCFVKMWLKYFLCRDSGRPDLSEPVAYKSSLIKV